MHNNIDNKIKDLLGKEEIVPKSVRDKKEEPFNMIRDMDNNKIKKKKTFLIKKI